MKLTYKQANDILSNIRSELGKLDGNLAFEVLEVETELEDKFKTHIKRLTQLQQKANPLFVKRQGKNVTPDEVNELIRIDKEMEEINGKEEDVNIENFTYGDKSERDLKPHLSLNGLRAFKPILTIKDKKK